MGVNMFEIVNKVMGPLISFVWNFLLGALVIALSAIAVFVGVFLLRYPFYAKKDKAAYLKGLTIKFMPYNLARWVIYDILTRKDRKKQFNQFGFSVFTGRQGSGKTMSLTDYLEVMRKRFPECKIVTNFKYEHATHRMEDWRDFFEIRNGEKGVIFALDEIQSEYNADSWKDFPETLLSEISQQRKQRIKIVCTAQVYSRIAKPIREQTFTVFCCSTYFHRLTYVREYDAAEYGVSSDSPYVVKKRCKPLSRRIYVQSDELRGLYDTYEKVERLGRTQFIPRAER